MGDPPPGNAREVTHVAGLYGDTAGLMTGVLDFIGEGLDLDEAVQVVAPALRISDLRARMDGLGQRVNWVDMTGAGTNPALIIPVMHAFASSQAAPTARCVVEPGWDTRTAAEQRELIRHEALINLAFAGMPVTVLCPYDTTLREPGILACAERTHPVLIRDGQAGPSSGYSAAAGLPAECDEPLDRPPLDAARLPYRAGLAAVRAFAAEHASAAGLTAGRTGDLVIAVSELAANTFRYTSTGGILTVWAAAGELICQVEDTGHITDPLAGRRRPPPDTGGGNGLRIVHQVCDLVELRTGPDGTIIRVHMGLDSR
ncbi:MAG: sensor histidine kinase [Actinomycetota bacterium]|nr:sensor histidine kinase [Actinomycetota bacterium]